jgi:hypothetical protein
MQVWNRDELLTPLKRTTNEQAALCISEQNFEDEPVPDTGLPCPLLENQRCLCYEARPLMCRMMFSSTPCNEAARAEMPSRLMSLNIVCLQLMEDIDCNGGSGYLIHALPYFRDGLSVGSRSSKLDRLEEFSLRPNRTNPGFLVPPEDRGHVREWLRRLDEMQKKK